MVRVDGVVRGTAALLLAIVSVSCATGKLKEYSLVPGGGTGVSEAKLASGLSAQAQYLDQEAMGQYVREKGLGALASPLRSLDLLAFILVLSNGGKGEVIVDPRGIRLFSGTPELKAPLEYASLYMELPADSDRQRILMDLQKLLFEGSTEVPPGAAVERLVLFPRPETFGKEGMLLLQGVYVNGVPAEMSLPFRAVPLEPQ